MRGRILNIFSELSRRNVIRAAAAYLVGGWFLVKTAYMLEKVLNLPEWFDALIWAMVALGFPIVMFLSWAFELTPKGFVRTSQVTEEDSISAKTGKRLDYIIIAGLVMVGGLILFDRYGDDTSVKLASGSLENSVAVLPFSNRSADVNDAFFADGVHDELLTQLSKVASLEVISRTSVMGYRDTDKRMPEIAKELGVSVILEGAVQRSGDRVRITVQLIDGIDDNHLWAENYDRELTPENLFDIQAEITQVIASSLEAIITGEDQQELQLQPTQNLKSYEAVLKAKLLVKSDDSTEADLKEAIKHYSDAIALDEKYAEAYAGKAYTQMALYWFHNRDPSNCEAGQANFKISKSLAPNALDTLLTEAFLNYWCYRDFKTADQVFDLALKVAPNNVDALAGKAFIERRLGQFDEAARDLEKAHRLDPLSFYLIPELSLTYVLTGEFEKSNRMIAVAKMQKPDSMRVHIFNASIQQFQGNHDEAYKAISKTGNLLPYDRVNYAIATRNNDNIREALEAWPIEKRWPDDSPELYNIARIDALQVLGDKQEADKALAELAQRVASDSSSVDWKGPARYSPVIIPGLLKDAAAIDALVDIYEQTESNDAMAALTHLSDIAEAFVRVDKPDRALDYVEKVIALVGPHIYLVYAQDPTFRPILGHPRFKKIKIEYEAWQAQKQKT